MTRKAKLDVELLLPDVVDQQDACLERLMDLLLAKHGVDKTHLTVSEIGERQLCIHFDPSAVSLGEVRELALRAGAALTEKYGHFIAKSRPASARRASALETRLAGIEGVLEAAVSPDGMVRVEFDRRVTDREQILAAAGSWMELPRASTKRRVDSPEDSCSEEKPASSSGDNPTDTHAGHGHAHGGIFGPRTELIFAGLCGSFLLVGWLLENFTDLPRAVSVAVLAVAYFFGGYYTFKEAWEKTRAGKFEIDFLMLVAAAGAAAIGGWVEGALLLFLFSVGHSLEGYAMQRAKRAIEALSEIAPPTARVRRDGAETELPVDQLRVSDIVIVKPDEKIAADGFVILGETSVDQSPITGESVPVDKRPTNDREAAAADPEAQPAEHRVFAGTINQAGAIEIQVTKTAAENTLARVVALVAEAETKASPTQKFTKQFERYFVPTVIAGVVLLLFAPLAIDEPFRDSFYRAMAVLVAASPCALAIATPSAVLSGVARAARGGVLVKGGGPLERLGRIDAIAFDKTGTLTEGKPRLVDVRPAEGVDEPELLRVAIAVENLSDHPLAKAVVRDAGAKAGDSGSTSATNLQSITGLGVQAELEGTAVHIGKGKLFEKVGGEPLPESVRQQVESLENEGRTTMIVRYGTRYLGVLGLMDTPREAATRTIAKLRELGVQRMIMISGDNQQVADAVARAVGIDEARGDLMPQDKVAEIKRLNSGSGVAMVGDGVNDAPAMAAASVGIAMGAAGSDVALETADVALMADNLDHLPLAFGLSRATRRVIRQNLWISLGMVGVLVPATLLGLNIGPAVALHEGSTLVVVFNALRLLAFRAPTQLTRAVD
jgi:Cd2+/Zn2+-exporting ATPase